MEDNRGFLHFWRPSWCPFKDDCRPKVTSLNNDLCFGAYSSFRLCINIDLETFNRYVEKHDEGKPAIAFISLTRKELNQFKDMIDDTLKYSTGVDPLNMEDSKGELWKIGSGQKMVKKSQPMRVKI